MTHLFLLSLSLLLVFAPSTYAHIDVTDYFSGSKAAPRLHIDKPENGEVLEDQHLHVKLSIKGYTFPSQFHDSSICIGLTTDTNFEEECFEQPETLSYHIDGLLVGAYYSLRVVLFERGKAIAVSVRNFRVGGILGILDDEAHAVTVKTAIQYAIQLQSSDDGSITKAEKIYRKVLSESPSHPDALHLMGLIFYQRGDASSAIPYIERALSTNKTFEGFHNSLGECFRVIGRFEEAKSQFELALALNPSYTSAAFNLGLTYQASRQYEKAIQQYQHIEKSSDVNGRQASMLGSKLLIDSKIRECDLLQALGKTKEAFLCWNNGTETFPDSDIFYNELGNFYGQFGKHQKALSLYLKAAELGSYISGLNAANMLDLLGQFKDAKSSFSLAIARAESIGLDTYHMKIRKATVLPRVMPAETSEINVIRKEFEEDLDGLLGTDTKGSIDNTPPLFFGFSLGHLLTTHGGNNKILREKLYRVYLRYCPALKQGYFIDSTKIKDEYYNKIQREDEESYVKMLDIDIHGKKNVESSTFGGGVRRVGFFSRFFHSHHAVGHLTRGLIPLLVQRGYHIIVFAIDDSKYFDDLSMVMSTNKFYNTDDVERRDGDLLMIDSTLFDADRYEGSVNNYPSLNDDYIRNQIKSDASEFHLLPPDINYCARRIRDALVDILIYPEIGNEPVTYFLSFARLAPVQVLWIGDGDTTGIDSIDYYVTSSVDDITAERSTSYSEAVVKIDGLGTIFVDETIYSDMSRQIVQSPRTALLERARFAEILGLPRAAHLYVVASSLYTLHPLFDDVILRILSQDIMGYIVVIDSANRTTLQRQYVNRLVKGSRRIIKKNLDESDFSVRKRVIFYSTIRRENNLRAIAAAHVILDPIKTSNYLPIVQALALSVPVVSLKKYGNSDVADANRDRSELPSKVAMAGRFAEALYAMMNYTELLVPTISDYVQLSLQLSHNTKLRLQHVDQLVMRRENLFKDSILHIGDQWDEILKKLYVDTHEHF